MLARTLIALSLSLAVYTPAHADDCPGFSITTTKPAGDYAWAELQLGKAGWEVRTIPKPGEIGPWRALAGLAIYKDHGHLNLVLGKSHDAFAVIDGGSDHGDTGKIQVFDAAGKQLASWGFADFMTRDERDKLPRSISHTQWLSAEPPWFTARPDGRTFEIRLYSGRSVVLTLGPRPTLK